MVQGDPRPAGTPLPPGNGLATRRGILNVLLAGSFLSWMAVLFFPVLKYLKRPPEASGGRQMTLSDEDRKKVAQSGFTIVRVGTERVIVLQDAEKTIHALQAKCTHEGCTVTYKSDEGLVWCACHNGKFSFDGRVISGPPPRPLAVYAVEGDLAGRVTVSIQGA